MGPKIIPLLNYFLILVYVSGAIGFVLNPEFFAPFTPFTLLLTSVVFLIQQPLNKTFYVISFFSVATIGFISEWIGIKTGLVFGNYYYGGALGYKLFGVPLTITLNWALLVNAGLLISKKIIQQPLLSALLSSLIITAIDYVIEQSAGRLDFWHFKGGVAGLHNYLGWFLVSLFAALLFNKSLGNGNHRAALLVLLLQLLFFGSLYFLNLIPL